MDKQLIEKLTKQSLTKTYFSDIDGDYNLGLRVDETKFAKLIINDIMKLIISDIKIIDEPITDYDNGHNEALTNLIETIKLHFKL